MTCGPYGACVRTRTHHVKGMCRCSPPGLRRSPLLTTPESNVPASATHANHRIRPTMLSPGRALIGAHRARRPDCRKRSASSAGEA
jgi:hypothetical protein